MSDRNPERWLQSLGAEDAPLRALIEAGRAERPSAQRLDALSTLLQPTFSTPSGRPGGGGAAGAPVVPIVATVLLALGIAAVWSSTHDRHGSRDTRDVEPRASAVTQPVPIPRAPSSSAAPTAPNASTPGIEPPTVDAGSAQRPPQLDPPAAKPAPSSVTELVLLEQAHAYLGTAPRRALAATAKHARLFPRGQYAQEREVLAIEALLALDERTRASARAARFLAQHPDSSHGRRVHALLAESRKPSASDAGTRGR